MKIKLLLILALSNYYSINAMCKQSQATNSSPKLDITKKLILQEQSLYDQRSDQGKVQFPYSLSKFTDLFKDVKPKDLEGDPIFPITVDIDQKSLDKISDILIQANETIIPNDSKIEEQKKIRKAAFGPLLTLSSQEHIKLINIAEFLGIPGLQRALESSFVRDGWDLKNKLYNQDPETKEQKPLVSDYILYFIIEKIKAHAMVLAGAITWDSDKQKIIKSQTKTLDQAIFIREVVLFLQKTRNNTLAKYLNQNPNRIEILETFPIETQNILKHSKFHFENWDLGWQ